jgi:hypothetical protein
VGYACAISQKEIATAVSGVLRALSLCAPAGLLGTPAAIAETVARSTLPAEIPAQPFLRAFAKDPSLRENMNTAFGDAQRGYKQLAFFASVDFDLIPQVLTVTVGTRHYTYDDFANGFEFGTATGSPLVLNHPNGACTSALACALPINLSKRESGFVRRVNLGQPPLADPRAPYCGAAATDPRCLQGGNLFRLDTSQ